MGRGRDEKEGSFDTTAEEAHQLVTQEIEELDELVNDQVHTLLPCY